MGVDSRVASPRAATSPPRGDLRCARTRQARRLRDGSALEHGPADRRDRGCSAPAGSRASEYFAELAPRLRRVHRQRRDVLAHAGSAHAAPDERRAGRAGRSAASSRRRPSRPRASCVVRSEYLVDDVNTFADLARRRTPVGILDHETGGDPERSARYRDVLAPAGIPHELRAAFVTRGRTWGAVHIARRASSAPFTKRRRSRARAGRGHDRERHPCVAALRRRAPWRRRRAAGPRRARAGRRGGARHAARARAARRACAPASAHAERRAVGHRSASRRSRGAATPEAQRRHGARRRRLDHAARVAARRRRRRSRGDRHRTLRQPPVRAPAPRGARRERPRARGRHAARPRPGHDGDRRGARRLAAHRPGSREEPVREARRRVAPGARRPGLPRGVPARGARRHAARVDRALRGGLPSSASTAA